jgi:hypothetical protein
MEVVAGPFLGAIGIWRDTSSGLAHNLRRSVIAIVALAALDEATARLVVAVAESLPPETFSQPQYVLGFQALNFLVTLLLCVASVAGAYLIASNDRRFFRSGDSDAPSSRFAGWMWRGVLAWWLIVTGSGIVSLALQFAAMFLGIEGTEKLDGIDWVSASLYVLLQALLAAFALLRVPEALGVVLRERTAARARRVTLFLSYLILFLVATLLMYALATSSDETLVSATHSYRVYYFSTSLMTVLSLLMSCAAARRFTDRADGSALVFD